MVKSGLSSDLNGSWQTSFSIPASSKGPHKIDARGATTTLDDVPDCQFTVSPGIKVEQATGRLGDVINVGDTLFASAAWASRRTKHNIRVTFDGHAGSGRHHRRCPRVLVRPVHGARLPLRASIPSDSFGDTTSARDVDRLHRRNHAGANHQPHRRRRGRKYHAERQRASAPTSRSPSPTIQRIDISATTDTKGSFSTAFKPPASGAGSHLVTVSDGTQAIGIGNIHHRIRRPAAPSAISPEAGTKFGLFDNKPIEFSWSVVEDPSGVVYSLEMSQKADFSGSVMRKENLDKPEFTSCLPARKPGRRVSTTGG